MKKIGILTINDYTNYGNRLQNYATQEVLKDLGFDVETIINETMHLKNKNKKGIVARTENFISEYSYEDVVRKIIKKIYMKFYKNKIARAEKLKENKFREFTNNYIAESNFIISDEHKTHNQLEEYDYFVVGSDQVWNPSFERFSEIDFLTFAPKYKRVAFSPSFGVSEIPEDYVESFSKWLLGMEYLSIRENAGKNIIKKLTGRDANVLVDPTLMISKEKWLSISCESNFKPSEDFILTFFLSGCDIKIKKAIKKIAKNHNLKVINLVDIYDLERYAVDPSEFIDFVHSANLIITDSFHASVFSILFEKPFIITDRLGTKNSMNSRIETLLSMFGLEDRHWNVAEKSKELLKVDYSHVQEILEIERNKTKNYLIDAMLNGDEIVK